MPKRTFSPATIEAWSAAVKRSQAWTRSTGPVTTAGRAKVAQNSTKAALSSAAFKWAMVYVDGVNRALTLVGIQGIPRIQE
jgi:hypothetical protein